MLAGVLIAPIVLGGFAQLYVFYLLPQLHWAGLTRRARGVPVYLSFACWEWVTFVLLSVYLSALGVAVRAPRSRGAAFEGRDEHMSPLVFGWVDPISSGTSGRVWPTGAVHLRACGPD